MSATRDKSQKIKLVVLNGSGTQSQDKVLGSELDPASIGGDLWVKAHRSHVIKADDLKKHELRSYEIQTLNEAPGVTQEFRSDGRDLVGNSPQAALEGLKQNIKTLNDLHARLRFMLRELEDFVIHESK